MRSWLPPDHLAWQVSGVTGQLDLSRFACSYRCDGQGQAPYDPQMMITLIMYCYCKGTRSSRKIAAACVDDVGCRVICGGAAPSHQAVASFARRHRSQMTGLFIQVLALLAAEGAVEGHLAAVDGSPVPGNASRYSNLTAAQLDKQVTAVQAELGTATQAWLDGAAPAPQQPPLHDDGSDGDGGGDRDDDPGTGGMPRKLTALAARLGRLQAAQAKLAGRQAAPGTPDSKVSAAHARLDSAGTRLARAEAGAGAKVERYSRAKAAGENPLWARRKPVPASQSARVTAIRKNVQTARDQLAAAQARAAKAGPVSVSATDPDSRMLPAKNGGWTQGWNLQIVTARRQVLLAIGLHDNPADAGALVTMIRAAAANCTKAGLEGRIRAWLADNGYASAASFQALQDLMLLVAVRKDRVQAGRGDGGRLTLPEGWEAMAARLATPAGKSLYKRRGALVEPGFAQFFARFGRYLNYRGHDAADAEINLMGAVHNMAKLLEHRKRQPQPAAATA